MAIIMSMEVATDMEIQKSQGLKTNMTSHMNAARNTGTSRENMLKVYWNPPSQAIPGNFRSTYFSRFLIGNGRYRPPAKGHLLYAIQQRAEDYLFVHR